MSDPRRTALDRRETAEWVALGLVFLGVWIAVGLYARPWLPWAFASIGPAFVGMIVLHRRRGERVMGDAYHRTQP